MLKSGGSDHFIKCLFTIQLVSELHIHCGLKVSHSQTKIDENFANYFSKPKAYKKCFIGFDCTCKGLQKSISELEQLNLSPRRSDTSKSTLSLKLMRLFVSRLNLCEYVRLKLQIRKRNEIIKRLKNHGWKTLRL